LKIKARFAKKSNLKDKEFFGKIVIDFENF